MTPPSPPPLTGVRVLDLSRLLPGPYCSLVLADLGADVVKIEEPGRGDYLRWWPPYWPHGTQPQSAAFSMLNRNKRSFALDLRTPEGAATLKKMAAQADVLIESFRPGVMKKLGLDYATLEAPRLIMVSISGYGSSGPNQQRAGHDLNYLARAGVLAQNARAGEPPHPLALQVADLAGGALFPATALLAALFARERTGHGTHIDASMADATLCLMPFLVAEHVATNRSSAPGEHLLSGGVPAYSVYPTSDGRHLAVAALEPKFWQALMAELQRPDLAASGLLTGEAGTRVKQELTAIFASATQREWVEKLGCLDACVEPVATLAEALADPQFSALQISVEQNGAALTQLRTPIVMSRYRDHRTHHGAPALGQDHESVCADYGLSATKSH